MYRLIQQELVAWRQKQDRLPLVIRGARQVGKTYVVERFGRSQFEHMVTINFDFEPKYKQLFQTKDPQVLIQTLSVAAGIPIVPGKTLLFLDEIQECPAALQALRYFKEQLPALHVIAAGSLLEFILNDANFSMPVGRVQYLYLKPLSLQEFLLSQGEKELLNYLEQVNVRETIPDILHEKALNLVRQYMILGGMPAVIASYQQNHDYLAAQQMQTVILTTYRSDFGKYASRAQHQYLQQLFERGPGLVGQQFKYVNIDPEMRPRDLKISLQQLSDAGLLYQVFSSSCSGLPLNTFLNRKKFKLLFLDVGLVNRQTELEANTLLREDLVLLNRGTVAEQFVGQELLANGDYYKPPALYYWERSKSGSMAEVDYITALHGNIIPIEVKAGTTGRLKSLHILLQEKELSWGVRISQQTLAVEKNILSLPFYLIHRLPEFLRQLYL